MVYQFIDVPEQKTKWNKKSHWFKKHYKKNKSRKGSRRAVSRSTKKSNYLGQQNSNNSMAGLSWFKPRNPFPRQFNLTTSTTELQVADPFTWASGYAPPIIFLRPSSLFDPLQTTGLGQKRYMYDSIMSNYYKKYYVTKFWIQIAISNCDNDIMFTAGITDDTANAPTAAQDLESICKLQNAQTVMVEADQGSRFARRKLNFSFDCNTWKRRNYLNRERAVSDVNTNPSVYPVLWIAALNRTGTTTPRFAMDVQLVAKAKYFERRETSFLT